VWQYFKEQQKEEKRQKEQQEQQVSCLSQTNTNEVEYNNNNGRSYTEIGESMESVFQLVNQIESILDTISDRQLKNSLKLTLKPFKEKISYQSGIEYKKAAGIYKMDKQKVSTNEYWNQKLNDMHAGDIKGQEEVIQ
jgi:hypothetical protein